MADTKQSSTTSKAGGGMTKKEAVEKSAMLELDDPGFTDGERHRPTRLH